MNIKQTLGLLKCKWPVEPKVTGIYGETVVLIPQRWLDDAIEVIEHLQHRLEGLEK